MRLIFDLVMFVVNAIVLVFTNGWAFAIVFTIIGIVTMLADKVAGGFCIFLAALVLINMLY